jgi:ferredoxin, 2Fe-2S
MPQVTFVNSDGSFIEVNAPVGENLMRVAQDAALDGIAGQCGGGLACATCHVLVDDAFLSALPPITPNEDQMLDCTVLARRHNSRLSCQIVMSDELDGLTVAIADPQI